MNLLRPAVVGLLAMAIAQPFFAHQCQPDWPALLAPVGFWAALGAHLHRKSLVPFMAVLALLSQAVTVNAGFTAASDLTRCKSQLKRLATDLEMYSTDHRGEFPSSLELLGELPVCPAGGGAYGYETHDGVYRIYCTGLQHEDACIHRPNFPEYRNDMGCLERP